MPILGFLKPMVLLSRKALLLYKRPLIVFLTIYFHVLLHGNTGGYMGLQGVTRGYRSLQGVTEGYKGLLEVTRGYMGKQRTIETFF